MKQVKAGIAGGAGYTAGELIRLLINHPQIELVEVLSTSQAGEPVWKVHQDLFGQTNLSFTDGLSSDLDLVFLCLGHGVSAQFLTENQFSESTKIIDLSNDFRLNKNAEIAGRKFVYGLPELQREAIKSASNIANPGCFATAIQLALLPLAEKGIMPENIFIQATTGSTGAGQKPSASTHFSWRDNNLSNYKVYDHQHEDEIMESLEKLAGYSPQLSFIPTRGNFSRGIMANIQVCYNGDLNEAVNLYNDFYASHPFTHVHPEGVHLKQVVNTNNVFMEMHVKNGNLLISSVIDNLLKGASGQAIQNANLMFGFEETAGLKLKASAF